MAPLLRAGAAQALAGAAAGRAKALDEFLAFFAPPPPQEAGDPPRSPRTRQPEAEREAAVASLVSITDGAAKAKLVAAVASTLTVDARIALVKQLLAGLPDSDLDALLASLVALWREKAPARVAMLYRQLASGGPRVAALSAIFLVGAELDYVASLRHAAAATASAQTDPYHPLDGWAAAPAGAAPRCLGALAPAAPAGVARSLCSRRSSRPSRGDAGHARARARR